MNLSQTDMTTAQELLGYLNFSGGRPDSKFQRQLNELVASLGWAKLPGALRSLLAQLHQTVPAFRDVTQAESVLNLVFSDVLPAYRAHHRDLLAHLKDAEYEQPFFLAKGFEAVLQQGAPWEDREGIIRGALERLNDFVGFRPIAVLENGTL